MSEKAWACAGVRDAGTRYSHFECDYCREPIGFTGTVRLDAGGLVVRAACAQCVCEGRRV